jgi:hypothetical protein
VLRVEKLLKEMQEQITLLTEICYSYKCSAERRDARVKELEKLLEEKNRQLYKLRELNNYTQ